MEAAQGQQSLWKPAADTIYLQEIGTKIATDLPITALAVQGGSLYAVMEGRLARLADGRLTPVDGPPRDITSIKTVNGALWVSSPLGVHRLAGGEWQRVSEISMVDFCAHLGVVYAATREDLFRFENGAFVNIQPAGGYLSSNTTVIMADGSQVLADPVRIGPIKRIASYSGTLYLLRDQGLGLIDGDTFRPKPIDWGVMPSRVQRDLLVQGSRLYVTTDRGLSVLRGMALTTLKGADGLPVEDTTCLAQGFDRDLWIGTTTGAIRKVGGDYHYFGAGHWLPGDNVNDIAVGDRVAYIATDAGLGIIRYEPYTLRKKAAYYERQLDEWGHKRLGFVHLLYWAGDDLGWLREISDNDGGHTAHYLAAMAFKYAATQDPQARAEAVDAFEAMVWLDDITPKDGFIARAIWSVNDDKGHRSTRGSGGLPAKWYVSDDGLWQWKGDTSSDEVNAHFYSVSLFHDLVAQGAEKDRAKKHLSNIASHIIENGWVLRDMDGQPTRWGQWGPDYLQRPYGFEARGLNGMEAQMYMIAAGALTNDPKFDVGLKQLLDWGYHTETVRQKLTFPPESVVPWDDELAFRSYYPLLSYTRDTRLRSIYLRSLERSWEVMRMQKIPFFNFVYGALTGNDCEVEQAARSLREWSLDTISDSYRNSHRADLAPEPGYVPYSGGTRAISPRETASAWGSRSSIVYDGGRGGRGITPAVGWLEDYWMGRYHGMIDAPKTTDPALLTVTGKSGEAPKAKPYSGPARPAG